MKSINVIEEVAPGISASRGTSLVVPLERGTGHLRAAAALVKLSALLLKDRLECVLDWALPIKLPTSGVRIGWSVGTLLFALFLAMNVPLMVAFESWRDQLTVRVLNWMTTCIFSLDILVHFRTAYITQTGELIRTPRLIVAHYTRGMLLFDLVSALPLEEIVSMATSRQRDSPRQVHMYWLGILRLPRLFLLARHLKSLTPLKLLNLMAVIKLIFIMVMITHWSACLWYYLSQELHDWPWIYGIRCAGWPDRDIYLFAFYRCFLLILGDKPDTYNDVERIFAVCLLSMGACMYAIVMGGVTMLVNNMWGMESRHKQRAVMMQDVLRYKGAKDGLRVRVHDYFIFMQRFDHPGMEGLPLLSELPSALHAEVMSSLFKPFLLKVQLFAYCEQPFIWRLAQRLRMLLYMPGNLIYEVDDVGHEMYIIWKGNVALLEPDGSMAALLGSGDHFGELGVMNVCAPRPHCAIALKATDVVVLSRADVQDAMRDFPESAQLVKNRALVQLEDHEIGHSMLSAALAAREPEEQRSQSETASDDDTDASDDSRPAGANNGNFGNGTSSAMSIDDTPPSAPTPPALSRAAGMEATSSGRAAGEAAAAAASSVAIPADKPIHRCWDEKVTGSRYRYYNGKVRHSGGDSSSQEPDNDRSREDGFTVSAGMGASRPYEWQPDVPEHSTGFGLVPRSISLTSPSNVKRRIIQRFVERRAKELRGHPIAAAEQAMMRETGLTTATATEPTSPAGMGALSAPQEAGRNSGGILLGHHRRSLTKHVVLAPAPGMPSPSTAAAACPRLESNPAALSREEVSMEASFTLLPDQTSRTIVTSAATISSARPRHPNNNAGISTSSTTTRRSGPGGGQGFPPPIRQLQRARTIANSHVDLPAGTAFEASVIVAAAMPRSNSFSSRIFSDSKAANVPRSNKMTRSSTQMLTSIDKLQLADSHDGTGEFSYWQPSQEIVEQQHIGQGLLQSMMLMPPQPQFLGLDPLAAVMTHQPRSGSPERTTVGVGLWRRKISGAALHQNPAVLADTGLGMMKDNDAVVTSSAAVASAMPLEGRRSQGRMGMMDARHCASSSSVTAAVLATLDNHNNVSNGRNANGPCDMIVHGWLESQTGQQQSGPGGSQTARLLEQQLAQTQKKLAETEAQLESLMQNPLQMPAMQAALSRAVSDVAAKLSQKVDKVLKQLSDALQGVSACTHDLSQQIFSVDDRLQRLEEKKDGGLGAVGGLCKPIITRPGYRKSPSGSGSAASMSLEAPSTEIEDLSSSLQPSPFAALPSPVNFNTQHGRGSIRMSTPRLTRTKSLLAHAGSLSSNNNISSGGGGGSSRVSLIMRQPLLRQQTPKPGMAQRSSGFFAGLRNSTFAIEGPLVLSETESCSKANSTITGDGIDTHPVSADGLMMGDRRTSSSGKQHPGSTAPAGLASSAVASRAVVRTLQSQSSSDPPLRASEPYNTAGAQLQQQQQVPSSQHLTPPTLQLQQQQHEEH